MKLKFYVFFSVYAGTFFFFFACVVNLILPANAVIFMHPSPFRPCSVATDLTVGPHGITARHVMGCYN